MVWDTGGFDKDVVRRSAIPANEGEERMVTRQDLCVYTTPWFPSSSLGKSLEVEEGNLFLSVLLAPFSKGEDMKRLILLALLLGWNSVVGFAEEWPLGPVRTWTDITGKFEIEAVVQKIEGDQITLNKAPFTTDPKVPFAKPVLVTLPLSRLSEKSKKYADTWLKMSVENKIKITVKDLESGYRSSVRSWTRKRDDFQRKFDSVDTRDPQEEGFRKQLKECEKVVGQWESCLYQLHQKVAHAMMGKDSPYRVTKEGLFTFEELAKMERKRKEAVEKERELAAIRRKRATPRMAADLWVNKYLADGTITSATYVGEDLARVSSRWRLPGNVFRPGSAREVFYRVTYVSRGGMLMQVDDGVIVTLQEGGFWGVYNDFGFIR